MICSSAGGPGPPEGRKRPPPPAGRGRSSLFWANSSTYSTDNNHDFTGEHRGGAGDGAGSSLKRPGVTLNESLWTRMTISKGEPAVKGLRCDTSSRPQRSFCMVLHTTHGDLWNLGLKWKATSARGWMLLPQVKSTWNLEDKPEELLGQLLRVLVKLDLADHLSTSDATHPWIRTISPGRSPPRRVPAKGSVCGEKNRLIFSQQITETSQICQLQSEQNQDSLNGSEFLQFDEI